jgi:hypothetical protein
MRKVAVTQSAFIVRIKKTELEQISSSKTTTVHVVGQFETNAPL